MGDNKATMQRRGTFKRHPSEIHLRELANEISGENERLGTYLGFKKPEMDKFKANHRNFEDRVFNMLISWKQRNFKTADLFQTLAKALMDVSRCDLASKVEDWRDEPHKSRDIIDEDEEVVQNTGCQVQRPVYSRSTSIVDELEFRTIASQIGDEWPKFATFLGLNSREIYKIKLSCREEDDRVFTVMVKWKEKMSRNTNMVKTLAKALEDSGRIDLKEQLLEKYNSLSAATAVEPTKEEMEKDLHGQYDLPPFLAGIGEAYKNIESPSIPYELFIDLCVALDPEDPQSNDWRMLASHLKLSQYISYLKTKYKEGPTSCVLWCWMKQNKKQTLEDLAAILDEMKRGDAATLIRNHGTEDDEEEA